MKLCCFLAVLMTAFVGNGFCSSVLLDTGVGSFLTFRTTTGPGQGVLVNSDTVLNQIGFYMTAPEGGNIKFMIWDESNSNLLFSEQQPLDPRRVVTLVLSNPFSFNLVAGRTYYFGVIADIAEDVSALYPVLDLTQNGLSLFNPNSNYDNFDHPVFQAYSSATIAIQLVGATLVPEPSSLGLLSVALLGFTAVSRRKFRAKPMAG